MIARAFLFAMTVLLAGCDLEALLADPKVVQREADSKAIGSACRYGMRSIEDCYTMNEKASKAAVFSGWKEMDQYMRENKIEGQRSAVAKPEPVEEIIEEKSPKAAKSDKAGAESKPKVASAAAAKAPPKAAEH